MHGVSWHMFSSVSIRSAANVSCYDASLGKGFCSSLMHPAGRATQRLSEMHPGTPWASMNTPRYAVSPPRYAVSPARYAASPARYAMGL